MEFSDPVRIVGDNLTLDLGDNHFGRDVRTRSGVGISEVSGPPVFHIKARKKMSFYPD